MSRDGKGSGPDGRTLREVVLQTVRARPGLVSGEVIDAVLAERPTSTRHSVGALLFDMRRRGELRCVGVSTRYGRYHAGAPYENEPCAWCSRPAVALVTDEVDGKIEPACATCAPLSGEGNKVA